MFDACRSCPDEANARSWHQVLHPAPRSTTMKQLDAGPMSRMSETGEDRGIAVNDARIRSCGRRPQARHRFGAVFEYVVAHAAFSSGSPFHDTASLALLGCVIPPWRVPATRSDVRLAPGSTHMANDLQQSPLCHFRKPGPRAKAQSGRVVSKRTRHADPRANPGSTALTHLELRTH